MRKGEIEDVWNSEFYKKLFLENRIKLRSSKYGLIKLSHLTSRITKGETPLTRGDSYLEQGTLFIKSENVLENTLIIEDSNCIAAEVHQRMRRSQLQKNDVLFNIVGASIGRACVWDRDEDANINQAVCLIRLKNPNYHPKWLALILNSGSYQLWINQLKSGGARDNIDLNQVNDFEVPRHPFSLQSEIVTLFETAYTSKKQKETEADALLASIDGYLLQALGIALPPPSERKPFFYTRSNKVSGGRFDPYYHQSEFEELEQALENGQYEFKKFEHLITYISSGATPLKSNSKDYYTSDVENAIPLLRVQNITAEGLKLDDVIFINRETHEKFLKRSQVFSGDLIITITGRIASSAIAPNSFEGNINQHSVIVRTNQNNVLNDYLAIYFNAILGQKFSLQKTTGGTRPALDYSALKSIKIPLPPLETQTAIAAHIDSLRTQAKHLRQQAEAELEAAKRSIESMLLGESV